MKLPIIRRKSGESRALFPFEQSMSSLQSAVSRLFDDAWFRFPSFFSRAQTMFDAGVGGGWWPKADISDTDKAVNIRMDVPGVAPDDITIEVDANTLTISGHTEKEDEEHGEDWYRIERETGRFKRSFDLPAGCDVDNISAASRHGTLRITIPKKPEVQKKKVKIDVQS